ncbi:MAG: hypothetical protein OHK0038_06470 [Flammeovirgaceae bacterium]
MPQFHKNFVGVRYRNFGFQSHLGQSAVFSSEEIFRITELWSRYYINPKFQVLAFVPWAENTQTTSTDVKSISGLGDIVILTNYNIFRMENTSHWKHHFWVGAGLKLPSGKYDFDENDASQVTNPNFQLGTGSLDFMSSFLYNLRYQKWGVNTDFVFKLNTQNSNSYRFGHRLSSNFSLFLIQKINNFGVMPSIGFYGEYSFEDFRRGKIVEHTGGVLVNQSSGLDCFYKNLSIGGNYQIPVYQNLADRNIKSDNRFLVHLTYMF